MMNTGYTQEGVWLEREIFGEPDKNIIVPIFFDNKCVYTIQNEVKLVKSNQRWDPSKPKPAVANYLHEEVADALNLGNLGQLGFFTGVNTILDRLFKTDGFFLLGNKGDETPWQNRKGLLVPVDLTFNNKNWEDQNHNAVQLIGQHLINNEGEINKEGMGIEARKIADAFMKKITPENRHYFF